MNPNDMNTSDEFFDMNDDYLSAMVEREKRRAAEDVNGGRKVRRALLV
jgi:hypothetical protein